jgi:hypothetical protein
MIKKLFYLLVIFFATRGTAQNLTATQKNPANVTPGSAYTMEVNIKKGSLTGFMRFSQPIPAGFIASEIESKGGYFYFTDNQVKIIWVVVPPDASFTISYKVLVPKDAAGSISMNAKISYVVEDGSKHFDLLPSIITIDNATTGTKSNLPATAVPDSTAPVQTGSTKTSGNPATTTANKPAPVNPSQKAEPVKVAPESQKGNLASINESAGKTYRVQIGAFSGTPNLTGVTEVSTVVLANGLTKYFSGNFKTQAEAVKHKKAMADKGFPGAFIVIFENGKIVK